MKPDPKPKRIKLSKEAQKDLRMMIWQKQGYSCNTCGRNILLKYSHMHHKKTRGAGGEDTQDNCLILCPECHIDTHGPRWEK